MNNKILLIIFLLCLGSLSVHAQLNDGLVMDFTFDQSEISGSNIVDSFGNDGVIGANATFSNESGISGQYLMLNGQDNSNINLGNDDILFQNLCGSMDCTISLWINPADINTNRKFGFFQSGNPFILAKVQSRRIQFDGRSSSGVTQFTVNTGSVINTSDSWYHITMMRDIGNNVSIWLNGTLKGTSSDVGSAISGAGIDEYIGSLSATGSDIFNGSLDEIKLWNRTLSEEEILQDFQLSKTINFSVTASDVLNQSLLSNFSILVENQTFSKIYNTSGYVIETQLPKNNKLYNITVYKDGYFVQKVEKNILTDAEVSIFRIGDLKINVYSIENNSLIYDQINLIIENSTSQQQVNITNGTTLLYNFVDGTTYSLSFSGEGNAFYSLTYNENLNGILNIYMQPNGTDIDFTVRDQTDQFLQGALVVVRGFVNGTYQTIGSKATNILGSAEFNLNEGSTYNITISKTGYNTNSFIIDATEVEYSIVLSQSQQFDYDGNSGGITYDYYPKNSTIRLGNVTFLLNITDINSQLTQFGIIAKNGSSLTFIDNTSSSVPFGGSISLSINTSNYNGSYIYVTFFYVSGGNLYVKNVNYLVDSTDNYSGSLLELKDFMINNVDLTDRIILWSIITLAFMLILALILRGVPNIVLSLGFSIIPAYLFGLNLIIIGTILTIAVVVGIAYGGRQ